MYNQIIELGGGATVVMSAVCDFQDFKAGDVIGVFNNVYLNVEYRQRENSNFRGTETASSNPKKSISKIQLGNVPMTSSLLRLFQENKVKVNRTITIHEAVELNTSENNRIYLKQKPSESDTIKTTPKISFTYYERTNMITIDEEYKGSLLVSFSSEAEGDVVSLDKDMNIPYLKLEVCMKGNIDKKDGKMMLIIPRASVIEKPIISKLSDTTTSYSLSFAIIRDYEDYDEEEKEENVEMFFWD